MKVTKSYLRQLIEEELKNMHEGEDLEDLSTGGDVADVVGDEEVPLDEPEAEATAQDVLLKVHEELERWLREKGLDVNPMPGPDEDLV